MKHFPELYGDTDESGRSYESDAEILARLEQEKIEALAKK